MSIGVDVVLGRPSVPGRGGAASDALLAQAVAGAGNVVFIAEPGASAPAPGASAPAVGHTVAPAEPDGIVRRVPQSVRSAERDVPALGLALAGEGARSIPADRAGRVWLRWAPDLPVVPVSEVWAAIEAGGGERLQRLVEGKRVLLMTDPPAVVRRTPIGPLSDVGIQAELLNAALTGAWLRETPRAVTLGGTLVIAMAAAWLGLASGIGLALAGLALLVVIVFGFVSAAPVLFGLALPIVQPFAALVLGGVAALGWNQVDAARRLRRLEGDMAGIREHLVRQESAVESLEEDLEAARAAVARSTGAERGLLQAAEALRGQLAAATAQEEQTRLKLQALERELRAADRRTGVPDGGEQERLRRRCAEVGIVTREPAVLALFRDLERRGAHDAADLAVGRAGHGQGAVRARRASAEPAGGGAVRGGQHGGHPTRSVRERDVRPREGQLHGCSGRSPRLLRAGRRRDHLPRRDRRGRAPSTRASSCACSRSARSSGSGATQRDRRGRPRGGRQQPGPRARRGRGLVPRGPLFRLQGRRPETAAAA